MTSVVRLSVRGAGGMRTPAHDTSHNNRHCKPKSQTNLTHGEKQKSKSKYFLPKNMIEYAHFVIFSCALKINTYNEPIYLNVNS